MKRFEDKVALVTGAGSGIGRAVALRLASEGARVFCVDLSAQGVDETKAQIEARAGAPRRTPATSARRPRCAPACRPASMPAGASTT